MLSKYKIGPIETRPNIILHNTGNSIHIYIKVAIRREVFYIWRSRATPPFRKPSMCLSETNALRTMWHRSEGYKNRGDNRNNETKLILETYYLRKNQWWNASDGSRSGDRKTDHYYYCPRLNGSVPTGFRKPFGNDGIIKAVIFSSDRYRPNLIVERNVINVTWLLCYHFVFFHYHN